MKKIFVFLIPGLIIIIIISLISFKNFQKDPGNIDKQQEEMLASKYPHDIGIENDPDVLFVEKFDKELEEIFKSYTDIKNKEDIYLEPDVPQGSHTKYSIKLSNDSGRTTGAHLYKNFGEGFDGTLYLRYYVKYPLVSKDFFHHVNTKMGGYDPPTDWPQGHAGECQPRHFNIVYEPVTGDGRMDTYLYWPEMKAYSDENICFGNHIITNSGKATFLDFNKWMCIEMMVKLNDPGEHNGELKIWHNGILICDFRPGTPTGYWKKDKYFHDKTGPPFEGFMWITADHPDMSINNMKFGFYDTKSEGTNHHNYVLYDHAILAKKRIGPIYNPDN